MTAHIDRAAEVIYDELSGKYGDFNMPTGAAQALDAAGLLATPEHDAAVAARALRDAAAYEHEDHATDIALGGIDYVRDYLTAQADRIEREGIGS